MDENNFERINIGDLKDKLASAFSCSKWEDFVKSSSKIFAEDCRIYIANKYFNSHSDTNVLFIDGKPYFNKVDSEFK